MKLPKKIKIKFSEEDRQEADCIDLVRECLLATALKRLFGEAIPVYCGYIIEGEQYSSDGAIAAIADCNDDDASQKPFYKESVVGMEVTLVGQ